MEELINKPCRYKAKLKNRDTWVTGYYFEMKETTYCFTSDYENHPVPTHYYLICEHMIDWGLPNEARMYEIDETTLKRVVE